MRIDYLYLSLAVVLLWLPLALFLGRRVRRELRNPTRGTLVTLPALLRSPWTWLELLRAGGAVWLLMFRAVQLPLPPARPSSSTVLIVLLSQVAVLLVGVWLQIMFTGSRRLRLAPLFYVLGITLVLCPWQVSLFGGLLGFTLTGMLQRWQLVFWILPVTLAAASVLFRQLGLPVLLATTCYLLPALLGLRPERRLAWVCARTRNFTIDDDTTRRHRRRHEGSLSNSKF